MKPIAVLSGDKRQDYICQYLNNHGYNAYLKSTMDFNILFVPHHYAKKESI
jgi:hypothetical protein